MKLLLGGAGTHALAVTDSGIPEFHKFRNLRMMTLEVLEFLVVMAR